ncbi:MAG: hypothetical protein NZ900_02225 [Synergistetes bacterium]|nr:hypothetical protein [Synergistota bacterium]MDW8191745.1 hypothetical protein [Synergistota bacterium]
MKGLLWFIFLLILDIVIPYGFLSNVHKITGAFTFWVVWGIIAVISIFWMSRKWGEEG